MTRAVVKLVPGMGDFSQVGSQIAQAMAAFGAAPPGARIPVDMPQEEERDIVVENVVRSANDATMLRLFDAQDRERFAIPLMRVDHVRFE